jgi:Tat protein secretion system quality control protein TatD with DNase activity
MAWIIKRCIKMWTMCWQSRRARCEILPGGGDDAAGIPRYARAGGAASRRRFSCGVHPLNQDEEYDVEELRKLAAEDGVVAMGETGLDYFYTPETKRVSRRRFAIISVLAGS